MQLESLESCLEKPFHLRLTVAKMRYGYIATTAAVGTGFNWRETQLMMNASTVLTLIPCFAARQLFIRDTNRLSALLSWQLSIENEAVLWMQSLSLRDSHFDSASDSEFLAALSYCFLTALFFSPLQFSPCLFPSIYLSIYRLETLQYRPSRPRFRLCRVSII
jgi:hypothetical protein